MEPDKLLELIADKVNKSPDGISRFLQANPYTDFDFYSLDRIVTRDIFMKYFYFESETSKNKKIRLFNLFKNNVGKNTVFLLGYQGCGKTTFANTLVDYYCKEYNIEYPSFVKIDCDNFGLISENNKIRKLFLLSFKKFISTQEKPLENFLSFFSVNAKPLSELGIYTELLNFYKYFNDLSNNRDIKNPEGIDDLVRFIESGYDLKNIFYIIFIISVSCHFNKIENDMPYFFIIDNLDMIESHKELKAFIKCIDDFTIEISKIFHKLKLYNNSSKEYIYSSKIKIVITMRETTHANIPKGHYSDAFRSIYTYYDVTEWYDKDDIVKKRINYLLKANNLLENVREALENILIIMSDRYTRNVIIPLFNNNYRKAIPLITGVVYKYLKYFKEYYSIKILNIEKYRYGARGILLKFIIDTFNDEKGDFGNILKIIGVIDLQDKKNNDVSIARIILSYLSNYTETKCDSGQNSINLSKLINDLDFIFPEKRILCSILEMYKLRDSEWTHLISFNTLEYPNNIINKKETTLHYSCAGKIYLENITTHFEFFSARIFKNKRHSLFCKENRSKDKNGKYVFDDIIENVFIEITKCCASLKNHNNKVCKKMDYLLSANNTNNSYLNSHFVAKIKGKIIKKQFHEERMITSHIGYIDIFRVYLLNAIDISFEEKIEINKILTGYLGKYIGFLNNIPIGHYTEHELMPYYFTKLNDIHKSKFEDFSIEINKTA